MTPGFNSLLTSSAKKSVRVELKPLLNLAENLAKPRSTADSHTYFSIASGEANRNYFTMKLNMNTKQWSKIYHSNFHFVCGDIIVVRELKLELKPTVTGSLEIR